MASADHLDLIQQRGSSFLPAAHQFQARRRRIPAGGKHPRLSDHRRETVAGSLWSGIRRPAKSINQETKKRGDEKFQKFCLAHSVAEFQKLLIEKCLPKSAIYSLGNDSAFSEIQAKQIQVLAVGGCNLVITRYPIFGDTSAILYL
jgi:hypothetical protein